jgi:hypothetical protein
MSDKQPTQEELDHAGRMADDAIRETFAGLSAGRCMYCDCQQFDNSAGSDSGMNCNCGHTFDSHVA